MAQYNRKKLLIFKVLHCASKKVKYKADAIAKSPETRMQKLTEQDGTSLNIVSENLEALKDIFPEAFTEDGVNFDTLRQLLGDEVDEGEEKYGLNWHGEKRARQIALTPSTGTLRPCPEESIDWETTQNLFIEGDNLEVLKLLQKSYAGCRIARVCPSDAIVRVPADTPYLLKGVDTGADE